MNKNSLKTLIQSSQINKLAGSNKYPSVTQMAKNLGRDVVKNVKSVAAGNAINASNDVITRRKQICQGCEFFNGAQDRCLKCGCFLAVKVYLKASSCPINKW